MTVVFELTRNSSWRCFSGLFPFFVASCPKGFTGVRCETSIEPTNAPAVCTLKCLNGGSCVFQDGKQKCE